MQICDVSSRKTDGRRYNTIQVVEGNLLESDVDIIVHQVNCHGVMGAGIAKQIREKFPNTYLHYHRLCQNSDPMNLIGHNLYTPESLNGKRIIIANIFGQNGFGANRQHTDYEALDSCFALLASAANDLKARGLPNTIGLPYNIGCGLGGGDWKIVSNILRKHLSDLNVNIYKFKRG